MGGSELEQVSTSQKVIDYLNELGAYAISIGMSAEEYWKGEPYYINTYINAEKIKQRKKNSELWLQGLYIYHAVGCLAPVFNPFSKEHKARPYMESPVALDEEEKQAQLEKKVEKFLDSLVGLKPKGE